MDGLYVEGGITGICFAPPPALLKVQELDDYQANTHPKLNP